MGVVFDEVVGEVQPDDDSELESENRAAPTSRPTIDADELRRALERVRRRDARLAAD